MFKARICAVGGRTLHWTRGSPRHEPNVPVPSQPAEPRPRIMALWGWQAMPEAPAFAQLRTTCWVNVLGTGSSAIISRHHALGDIVRAPCRLAHPPDDPTASRPMSPIGIILSHACFTHVTGRDPHSVLVVTSGWGAALPHLPLMAEINAFRSLGRSMWSRAWHGPTLELTSHCAL